MIHIAIESQLYHDTVDTEMKMVQPVNTDECLDCYLVHGALCGCEKKESYPRGEDRCVCPCAPHLAFSDLRLVLDTGMSH